MAAASAPTGRGARPRACARRPRRHVSPPSAHGSAHSHSHSHAHAHAHSHSHSHSHGPRGASEGEAWSAGVRNALLPRGGGAGKVLFVDAYCAGVAGDMVVAALADLGVPFGDCCAAAAAALGLEGVTVSLVKAERSALVAPRLVVREEAPQPPRDYEAVRALLDGAAGSLTPGALALAHAAFRRLAEAEAKCHGVDVDSVHFHEVGCVDSVVDVVCACAALDWVGASEVSVSPLPMGRGHVRGAAHGPLPNPPPAVVQVLCGAGIPTYDAECDLELVTPTGACLVAAARTAPAQRWPGLVPERVSYGAGTRDPPDRANLLRLVLGTPAAEERRGAGM